MRRYKYNLDQYVYCVTQDTKGWYLCIVSLACYLKMQYILCIY